jgi:predicted HNH restriction endonuclease
VTLKAREDRLEIIAALGGKCVTCGFSDARALDINHMDRRRKLRMKSYPLQRRVSDWRKNMAHLEVLCANCHRIHTYETVWVKQRTRF